MRGRTRLGWGVADQALSSLTNFALALVVARAVDLREFGAFSLVFAAYTVVLGVARAVATEPLAVRYAGAGAPELRSATGAAAGASLVLGVAAGIGCALASLPAGGALAQDLLALAVVLPGLVVQDSWRLSFFAGEQGARALVNDLVWAVMLAAGLALLLTSVENPSAADVLLVWGGTGTFAAVVGALQAAALPAVRRTRAWLRETIALSSRYAGEFVTTVAGAQLILFVVGAAAGLAETGALRGGQVVLGPLNVLFMGTALVAVPEAMRALRESRDRLDWLVRAVSGALGGAALAWGAAVLALPDDAGEALLGATWGAAEPVVLPLTLWLVGLGAAAGPTTALRALGAAGRSLRTRVAATAAAVVLSAGGALVAGAEGAAWGLAAASGAAAVLWWIELRRTA